MEKTWNVKHEENSIVPDYGEYHPVILKLLKNRGIQDLEDIRSFFNFDYEKNLTDSLSVSGMKKATERIALALERKEKVAIFGDYDADGVTATALIYETLEDLGFKGVSYYIPDRQSEGYGVNEEAIKYLSKNGVSLIITVDCGITSISEIRKAKELGIDVIITDHHHVPENLPEAEAIINPNLEGSGFKFRDMAGVGVAFKLASALYQTMDPEKIDHLKWTLDLVAIGTIADCVSILGENRVLVKYGLIVLSKTRRVGLQEMFKVGRIDISENNIPGTHKVAFQIAPRINAAGRMDHASVSYKLIIEKNRVLARDMALEVEDKNQDRQKITSQIVKEVEIIASNAFKDKKFIIAENVHWPVGILGLVAGKVMEEFKKPTAVFQKQEKEYVGSLRSTEEVNMMEVLEECSDLLIRFGGHAQAAGLRLSHDRMNDFYERFEKAIEKRVSGKDIPASIDIDLELDADDINWDLVRDIKLMEPFGVGNPEPVFLLKNMVVCDFRVVGNGSKHLKMSLRSAGGSPKIFDAIGFGMGEKIPGLKEGDGLDVVCHIEEDEWNGNKKMQIKIIDMSKNGD